MEKETIEALYQKAQQAVSQRRNEEARQYYQQALALNPDLPDVHYGLATVCFLLNDLPSAAHHFKEVTRLDDKRAGAYINLGAIYNRLDLLDEAIPVLRKGIQLDHARGEGYYNLGLVHRRKGQTDLAIQAYREATRVNPRMADAHFNLANLYFEKGLFGQAANAYQLALELRPTWDKARAGYEQAEEAQEAARKIAHHYVPKQPPISKPSFDPNRQVDPLVHGSLLSILHKGTIESDAQGRQFLQILEDEIEPALKELSSCLLYPDVSAAELDHCLQKFETALANMRTVQRSLQTSMDRVRTVGEQLLKS